jgi:murein L,D-transpeptidase YcbB/YkuD
VRVVIFYSTAAATESRGMLFFEDIYGHDRKLEMLLAREVQHVP